MNHRSPAFFDSRSVTFAPVRSALLGARRALTILLIAEPSLLGAQGASVFDNAPPARWIAPPGIPGDSLPGFHGRRTFGLAARPERFVVHVSADNRYRLYVNGTQVSSGPQRSDLLHWRYETVNIAPQLRAGANVIAAVVWNWGPRHPVAQHSFRSGFLLQGDGAREAVLSTGPGWKLHRDSSYSEVRVMPRDVRNAYYAATQGEEIDGARHPWGWESAGFDDRAWFTVPTPAAGGSAASGGGAIVGQLRLHAVPRHNDYGDADG